MMDNNLYGLCVVYVLGKRTHDFNTKHRNPALSELNNFQNNGVEPWNHRNKNKNKKKRSSRNFV